MNFGNGRKDSFVFYKSYRNVIDALPIEERLAMFYAIVDYGVEGIEPQISSVYLKAIFLSIKHNIDYSNERYRACVENGKHGGRPTKNNQRETKNNLRVFESETKEKSLDNQKKPKGFDDENLTDTYTHTYTQTTPPPNFDADADSCR
jgi:hypothetical protein